ncbi:YGL091Cp-like protein [Eremomyces bilateralis CBS 781.70]|uniref:YGL091Cp-like protein n=1 Tax=Eremomyces bilateralis CBS 781.70 TaxID=1392243 RepID=A0A6G1GHM2_9PEZI|nr:YGL091Cp-like protein [Eremomyces bilateralis CBS 781.70]KAF1817446.1 YGL091Cp-like protein [Eremomyces bilateralis CBS 781.70]
MGPDPDIPYITERLSSIKHKILVLSGKGGVGKSTLSVLLSHAFASSSRPAHPISTPNGNGNGHTSPSSIPLTVGLLDADITGPSIPKMLSLEQEPVHVTSTGWSPLYLTDTLCAISIQNMLPSNNPDTAIIWRGAKKTGLLKQFLRDVEWGDLDMLVVDTPPGTSDEHLALCTFMRDAGIDGAVLVSTPQEVALLDVRRQVDFCRKAGIPIIGIVENMSGFVCPNCTGESQIFRPTTGGARKLAKDEGIAFLGAVPLDPRIGMACDFGEDFLEAFPESKAGVALRGVVREVGKRIGLDVVDDDAE